MKILDCTLRDGGFITDFNWDLKFANRYYNLLSSFNMPYIELGYWKQKSKSLNPFYLYIHSQVCVMIVGHISLAINTCDLS